MWIDTDTGVLLKLEGTSSDGKVVYYVKVNDITFNQGVDHGKFKVADLQGWKVKDSSVKANQGKIF